MVEEDIKCLNEEYERKDQSYIFVELDGTEFLVNIDNALIDMCVGTLFARTCIKTSMLVGCIGMHGTGIFKNAWI